MENDYALLGYMLGLPKPNLLLALAGCVRKQIFQAWKNRYLPMALSLQSSLPTHAR